MAPKDIPLNAMRDLWAACGDELEAAVPHRTRNRRYEHASAESVAGAREVLRAAIADGRLAPGSRLPSSRPLATRLGLSRARVEPCYGELAADGVLGCARSRVFFVPGEAEARKRSCTGRYKRYYRCSSHLDVNVPEDEANEYIATVVAEHLCVLWRQGGFTRRVTDAQARVRSELAEAREMRTLLRTKIRACKTAKDSARMDALLDSLDENEKLIDQLEQRDRVASVPSCLKVFMACEGDLQRTRAAYLALGTDQRRTVLKELTAEILMYPAGKRAAGTTTSLTACR